MQDCIKWILANGVAGAHFGAVLGDDFSCGCILILKEAGVTNGCYKMGVDLRAKICQYIVHHERKASTSHVQS